MNFQVFVPGHYSLLAIFVIIYIFIIPNERSPAMGTPSLKEYADKNFLRCEKKIPDELYKKYNVYRGLDRKSVV